jgi:hypothetical protein
MKEGRSKDQKAQLVREITETVVRVAGTKPESVMTTPRTIWPMEENFSVIRLNESYAPAVDSLVDL